MVERYYNGLLIRHFRKGWAGSTPVASVESQGFGCCFEIVAQFWIERVPAEDEVARSNRVSLKVKSVNGLADFFVSNHFGKLSEWFKVHAWKACILERVSRVRIPDFPY